MSLKNILIRSYILLIFTFLIVISSISIITIRNTTNKINNELSYQLFESKGEEIAAWLDSCISELRIIAQTNEVREMDLSEIDQFVENLNSSVGTSYGNEWGTFAIGTVDGIGYVGGGKTINISSRPYFTEGLKTDKEYLISSPVESKTDQHNSAIVHYPLKKNGKSYGFINVAINLSRLAEIANGIHFYDGKSFIIDHDRNIYASNSDISKEEIDLVVSQLRQNHEDNFKFTDRDIYFCTHISNTTDWYLCTKVSSSVLYEPVVRLLQTMIIITIVVLVISLFVCIKIARLISNPISRLNQTIESASDDLQVVAGDSNITEINSLAKTFNRLIQQVKELIDTKEKNAIALRKSEIRTLQAQINPHFLYNTLDAINWKAVKHDDEEMSSLIGSLSDFYRISLSNGNDFISLKEEIHHVQSYINIQSIRFDGLFTYTINIDDALRDTVSLKLILQPIVENAIVHGIRPKGSNGILSITAKKQNQTVHIEITDNGVGMSEELLQETINGLTDGALNKYGLFNVNQRIQLVYGEKYGISIHSTLNKGTTVSVDFPYIVEN